MDIVFAFAFFIFLDKKIKKKNINAFIYFFEKKNFNLKYK